jgi:acyl-coenzyme A synthetase/AMP-(fatty) acid ligase
MKIEFPERFNMSDYFLYHNVEEGREGKVCLYFEDEQYTYGETVRMANRVGNALRRECGVRMEDRVLIVLPDCPEFAWTWFGVSRTGAVITMVNPLLPAADYKYYLEYTRARVAVIHESLVEHFARRRAGRNICAKFSSSGASRVIFCRLRKSRQRCRMNSHPPTRTATTSPSGCSHRVRPGIRRARCICNTICRSIQSVTPSACSASMSMI